MTVDAALKEAIARAEAAVDRLQPIDIPRLMADLIGGGLSLWDVSVALGEPRSTVQRWADGTAGPNFENGRKLVVFYEHICRAAPPQKAVISLVP